MPDPTNLPIPVWEQAAIIGIFSVILVVLVVGLRFLLNDQRRSQLGSQKDLLQQQQDFIEKRDLQWQNFLQAQARTQEIGRADDRARLAEMTEAINKLVEVVGVLSRDFSNHVAEEDAKFDMMLTERQKANLADVRRKRDTKP